ncbi:ComEC/Rec2 family competence protein [Rhizobium sp. C4]|uniref:ComEC/Rec2 family competence protein n=1 Tax=Rhizobium sp. C4 TaxID=1349800 RepID=UPI001E409951|nr:ComEC/Rec2 family competence protein [Rhizobium sp. C4]MCD2171449.1 ComEC/Rec2 family competence protein [Rhizobium sp. C4]
MGTDHDILEVDDAPQRRRPPPRAPGAFQPIRSGKKPRLLWPNFPRAWARLRLSLLAAFEEEAAHGHLFLLYPVFMIIGAVWWFSAPQDPPAVRLIAWTVVLLPLAYVTRYAATPVQVPVRLGVFVLAGALAAWCQTARSTTVVIDSPITTTITARVIDVEMREAGRWRYTVEILKTEKPRLKRPPTAALLGVRGQGASFPPGTVIKGLARLQPPAGPAIPGLNDFAFSSYFNGIGAIGGFMGHPHTVDAGPPASSSLSRAFQDWLSSVRSAINQRILSVLPGDTGAFASALVTNDTAAFSKEGMEALRISGLAHVISISGLHMVLAAGISFVGLRMVFSLFPGFIQSRPAKTYAAIGAITASGLYLLISGMPVPAVRSFIMLAVGMGGVIAARTVLTLRSVALATFAILIVSPSSALGPSFQMSFAAAAALISGYSLWKLRPTEFRRLSGLPFYAAVLPAIRAVGGVMLTSEIAGIATAVFSVTHFHRLTLLGTLGNVAAMPFITFIVMPAGFLAVLLMPFGLDYYPLIIMGLGLQGTMAVARFVSSLGGDIVTGQMAPWVLPAASLAFVLAILPHSRLFRLVGASLFTATLALIVAFGSAKRPDMVIAETADLVGIRSSHVLATNTARPPSFIMDQWTRALVVKEVASPDPAAKLVLEREGPRKPLTEADEWKVEDAMEAAGKSVPTGTFVCSGRDWCMGKLADGLLIATFTDFAFQGAACRQAQIVIAAAFLRQPECGQGEAQIFDRNALRRRGALALYLEPASNEPSETSNAGASPAFRIIGALDGRDRPWLRHHFYNWRSNSYGEAYHADQW